jgi:hypothetical protein
MIRYKSYDLSLTCPHQWTSCPCSPTAQRQNQQCVFKSCDPLVRHFVPKFYRSLSIPPPPPTIVCHITLPLLLSTHHVIQPHMPTSDNHTHHITSQPRHHDPSPLPEGCGQVESEDEGEGQRRGPAAQGGVKPTHRLVQAFSSPSTMRQRDTHTLSLFTPPHNMGAFPSPTIDNGAA